jgi:hypothetical protein
LDFDGILDFDSFEADVGLEVDAALGAEVAVDGRDDLAAGVFLVPGVDDFPPCLEAPAGFS